MKQGITNTLAVPIDRTLYIYLSVSTLSTTRKNPFKSKHFHPKKQSSNKVKLPKVGSNAIVQRDNA